MDCDEVSGKQGWCLGSGDLSNLLALTTAILSVVKFVYLGGSFPYLISYRIFHNVLQVFIAILLPNMCQYICALPFFPFALNDL